MAISIWAASVSFAQSSDTSTSRDSSCDALLHSDFSNVQDAPTQITEVALVGSQGADPAYCRVQGYVAPQVGFELRLPASNWNGKLLEVGNGGWGGAMFLFLCTGPMRKGYACIATDTGHRDASGNALWAMNNLQGQIDWGYRSTHVTALAGKAIVRAYYHRTPRKSVMLGCSTGGYQGLVEAQRFPWDFDGIIALSPDAGDEGDLGMRILWHMRHFLDIDGKPKFTPSQLRLLHDAALAKCDLTDGVKDGIVGDPVGCRFNPEVLMCGARRITNCLTTEQVDAARKIYGGPTTSNGTRISTRGVFAGSELEWSHHDTSWALELFRYALFVPAPGHNWKFTDFDFDQDYKRLGMGVFYTDSNPDLRKFKAAGGKLIVAQGGNDTVEMPGSIVDYYETVERTMGGRAATTQDFFRFFLIPGMNHCSGGDGAFAIDYLSYLEDWVETGNAPVKMIGAHVPSHKNGDDAFIGLTFPLDPSIPVSFMRPVYPFRSWQNIEGMETLTKPRALKPRHRARHSWSA